MTGLVMSFLLPNLFAPALTPYGATTVKSVEMGNTITNNGVEEDVRSDWTLCQVEGHGI